MYSSSAQQLAEVAQARAKPSIPGAIPAPVLGWNARDSVDGMAPGYAVQLDNFFPYNGFVTLRGGSQVFSDGLGGPVETLARWADAATEKALAAANGTIWEVFSGGKTSLGTGFSGNDWQWDQTKGTRSATAAIALTYLVNGVDVPQNYNGTALAACTWTTAGSVPLTLTNLHNVHISKDVLFLAEKGELGFWHGPKGQVGPGVALSWFDLGTILPGGGETVAIATMTLEGGEGPDDYTAFVASTGWVALYRGGDPGQATDWDIVGRFPLGQALGKRCVLEVAGDIIVMTVNGYISLRQFIQIGGLERQSFAFNDLIQPEVVRQTGAFPNEFGWQPVLVPSLTLALFNVPQSSNNFVQHIINTQTRAWGRLLGWNGLCWLALQNDLLLYGDANGNVVSANVGGTDLNNAAVTGEGVTAFSYFGQRGINKHYQMFRPILETIGSVSVSMAMATDFDLNVSTPPLPVPLPETAGEWDSGEWDSAEWGGSPETRTDWLTAGIEGYSAAAKLTVQSTGTRCRWKSTDLFWTPGGSL